MNEEYRPYFPDKAEVDAFYEGRSARAAGIFSCRYFAEAAGGAGAYRFCLWAPNAKSVSIVGDFNSWDAHGDPMERFEGLWLGFVGCAKEGDNYKYRIEGADGVVTLKSDPYAIHAERAPGTASKVWSPDGYEWGDGEWLGARERADLLRSPISIYELHPGSWRVKEGYEFPSTREIADELCGYIKEMGFTHVELMPVNEYPFDGSWGYQVTGFFAVTSRFGTPQDFMYFVDTMHRAGIGVIVDWVPAHFPRDAHGLAHFDGTWLYEHKDPRRREHPLWGTYEFNYDRPEVVSFLVSSAMNLIDTYHVDGLRVDAVSSMLYLDYGRDKAVIKNKDGGNIDLGAVEFIKAMNSAVLGSHPGVMTIAEEATAYPLVTKPPYDGGLGFSFKWNMGFMHDTLDFMSCDPYFRHGSHDKLTFSMHYAFSENYILPYSHDEVVHGKKSMIDKMFGDYDAKFAALRALYGWLFGHPGKKLMFMGCEFAQFIEWDYQKELDWFLMKYPSHAGMQAWVRALNELYCGHEALYARDDSWDGFQWLSVDDRKNSVFAFMRSGGGSKLICIYNFSEEGFPEYELALPEPGRLKLLLSSDSKKFGGRKDPSRPLAKKGLKVPQNPAVISLPGTTALFYEYI